MGLVWSGDNWLLTADWYRIQVEDRIARSTDFTLTEEDREALVAAGNPQAASLSRVGFFVNDFDTTTTGSDLVGSLRTDHFGGIQPTPWRSTGTTPTWMTSPRASSAKRA